VDVDHDARGLGVPLVGAPDVDRAAVGLEPPVLAAHGVLVLVRVGRQGHEEQQRRRMQLHLAGRLVTIMCACLALSG
jgi:hypothetical protein